MTRDAQRLASILKEMRDADMEQRPPNSGLSLQDINYFVGKMSDRYLADRFAGEALNGIVVCLGIPEGRLKREHIAKTAYDLAEAMIMERNGRIRASAEAAKS